LVEQGYLRAGDPGRLAEANARLLDVRVALHRVTGSRSDALTLQEQDAVAAQTGAEDADALVRELAGAARAIAWLVTDVFTRLESTERGPSGRVSRRDRDLGGGVVVRDGRVAFSADATVDATLVLRAAAAAAGLGAAFERASLERSQEIGVAECAALLDDDGFDGAVARRAHADLLLLAALLHDLGKGMDGDHSVVGAETAVKLARRIGVDEPGVATLDWLVRHHLALADTATRRDLSEEATITRFGRLVGTSDRLDLLYALTVGDSRATGPAAWGPTKAALV